MNSVGVFSDVWACVDAIAKAASSVPVRLMQAKRSGSREEITGGHPLLDMLENPNPEQGEYGFRYEQHQNLGIIGESYIHALGSPPDDPFRRPEEWWGLRADGMAPRLDESVVRGGKAGSPVERWVYTDPDGTGKMLQFLPSQIVSVKRPNPFDPVRGLSPLTELRKPLNILASALTWHEENFKNNAWPGLTITSENAPAMGMRDVLKKDIEHNASGAVNAGRHLWLWSKGIEVNRNTLSPQEASWIELIEWATKKILGVYKCPPFVLSDLEHASWSNSREQQRFFFQNAVIPANRLWFDSVNSSPMVMSFGEGLFLEPDYSGVEALQEDAEKRMRTHMGYVRMRAQTPNEVREAEELGDGQPLEGADDLHPFPGQSFMFEQQQAAMEHPFDSKAAAKALREAALTKNGEERRALLWKAFAVRTQPITSRYARRVRRLIRELRGAVLEEFNLRTGETTAVKGADDPMPFGAFGGDTATILDVASTVDSWKELLEDISAEGFALGGEDVAGVALDLDDLRIQTYLDGPFVGRIQTVVESRLHEVGDVILDSVDSGASIGETSKRLRELFDDKEVFWAERIARTETTGLYNQGAVAGLEDAGIEKKQWLSSRDSSVRESHVFMDGVEVPVGEDFVFPSGARGPFPGLVNSAAEAINCRCTVLAGSE